MADALVSALAQTILGNLNSVALQEFGLVCGLKDELNNLKNIFGTIQFVLQDAELKQRKNEAIQSWLGKLKDAAYDVDNILDQIATEILRRRVDSERGMQHQLKSFLSSRNPLLFRSKMAHKVKNIRQKLDAIANEKLQFHLTDGVMDNRFGETLESRQTSSLVNELEIYGRKKEKEMIIKELVDSRHEEDEVSVYGIWGMAGLGKTTLAQLVYNDERIRNHFELHIWVCVFDDFSIRRLVSAIIQSIEGGASNISELDPLQRLLQERLRGRKFLLVLDDVWNENHRLWDGLKEVLRCGSKGSMLMVTTRIEKVASMMATITPHNIACLYEDDSWSLFKQRAFTTRKEENLVAIGKVIAKKCGGVPLAINALGSLMQFKSHENEWLAIKESEVWHPLDESGILPALRLSYDNLLPQMRQCFAYCCIFPKDHVMVENELIQLWMANGFIPSEGQIDLYLTGQLIFKELVWRSFFQDVEINNKGDTTCRMHDLMHDLAQFVMRHESYILEHGKVPKFPKMLRHLSFDVKSSWVAPENESKLKLPIDDYLHSFIVHRGHNRDFKEGFFSFLSKQQYMRVLDMNSLRIDHKLPSLVCKLKYLRYLVMSCYKLKRLPESLICLLNLQTLKLTDSEKLLELPKGLKVMKNLSFLEIQEFDSLVSTPPGLRNLTCLRTLSIFIVSKDASHQIDQLKELNLGGKLSIQGLENVRNFEDAKSANLMRKRNLTSLKLSWTYDVNVSAKHFEEVLEGLQPHENLEKICIESYRGSRLPNWMSTLAFKYLNEISLEYCGIEHLPPFGKLPSLECLKLKGMGCIKYLGTEWHGDEESSFPVLTTLTIQKMPNLGEWTIADSAESFPCLRKLKIEGCPKLSGLPFLPTLRSLDISDSSVTLVGTITSLTSLKSLVLSDFADLDVLPSGLLQNHKDLENLQIRKFPIRTLSNMLDNLSSLRTLHLDGCSKLEFLPEGLQCLNALENLEISSCDSLESVPATILESLSSLVTLSFQSCKKLNPLSGPLQKAPVLQYLLIDGLPELKHLPDCIHQLSALRQLDIWDCEGLCSLPSWIGSLQSLIKMTIWSCNNLKSLPDGFKSLKSLRDLSVAGCRHLGKRCKKPNGEDWPKISHIQNILINDKTMQGTPTNLD